MFYKKQWERSSERQRWFAIPTARSIGSALELSAGGAVMEEVRRLRGPGVFCDGDGSCLLYSVAGEQRIAIARLAAINPEEQL